jgi:transcriptional regulatory protein RtcR
MRKTVVIGFLGNKLDASLGVDRWERWRPTVSLCQHEDLLIDRFELLHDPRDAELARRVAGDIVSVSPETRFHLRLMGLNDPWDFADVYAKLHQFATSYPFDTQNEEYLIHITTGSHVAQICLYLLTESRHLPGRLLQAGPPRRGSAATYSVIDLDLTKYDQLAARFRQEHREGASFLKQGIETRNRAFNILMDEIEHVATHSTEPLLLTGPTGSGKTQLARRVYELKHRRHQLAGEMVEVNCATLRGDGAMSALFGHVKGAFTGAMSARGGLLKRADGGLLFLDEIGELGGDEQAMLLRAIEEGTFLPMGSDRPMKVSFQLLAGTNADLATRVRDGRFREDLLARINLWSFRLPGLRERREDIEPNLAYELAFYTERSGTRVTLSQQARTAFLHFAASEGARWNGNFRDLRAAVTRMATLASGGRITVSDVGDEIARLREQWRETTPVADESRLSAFLDARTLDELDPFDRRQLAHVVEICMQSGSLSDAGRRLFEKSRLKKTTSNDSDRVRKYLQRFGISWGDFRSVH